MEERKAPQYPLDPQDRTHILAALANCLNLLSEADCTLLRSHLEAAAHMTELYRYFGNEKQCVCMHVLLLTRVSPGTEGTLSTPGYTIQAATLSVCSSAATEGF